jgi:hypothetical protein
LAGPWIVCRHGRPEELEGTERRSQRSAQRLCLDQAMCLMA